MLDFKLIKNNLEDWEKGLKRRGAKFDLNKILKKYDALVALRQENEGWRAERNSLSHGTAVPNKDISGAILDEGLPHTHREWSKLHKNAVKAGEAEIKKLETELEDVSSSVPNLPMDDVPDGGEDDGKVISSWGEPTKIKKVRDHIELGTKLNILDIERGAKASGSRFYYLKNQAVQLEFALVNFVLDIVGKHEFEFLMGPQLLGEKAMLGAGYLGKAADEIYKTQDDLYLIGSSEQSILAYHMDEVITVPRRYASFSTCFRREAGSYGKDVKGIIRVHQFDKVEMFSFVAPEESAKEHEFLIKIEEEILQALEIPYQAKMLAAGDLGIASAKSIDLESWLPSQDKYRESHSCSNCTDWQARRLNIRFKNKDGKNEFVHTLNGTAISITRFLAIFLENHQQEDGSVKIPKALQPYCGFTEIR